MEATELTELLVESLWNKSFPNGSLIINDSADQRKNNFRILCNLRGKSGALVSELLDQNQIGEVLNLIEARRISHRIGELDF